MRITKVMSARGHRPKIKKMTVATAKIACISFTAIFVFYEVPYG